MGRGAYDANLNRTAMSARSLFRSRWAIALATLLTAGATACIIGPKQDDPSSDSPAVDSGTMLDGSVGGADTASSGDTTPGPLDGHDAVGSDTGSDSSDGSTDGASDGATDGCASGDASDACTGGADAVSGG